MKKDQETFIALPGGEWLTPLQQQFEKQNITWRQESGRNYRVDFDELGISGVIVRSKDVPRLVYRPNSPAIAGFTGSDILVQSGIRDMREDPQDAVVGLQDAPQASVYLGLTPNAYEQFGPDPTIAQILEGVHRLFISGTRQTVSTLSRI